MRKITTTNAPAAIGPYSQAVLAGNMLYTSGQIALNPASGQLEGKDIKAQTEQIMKNLSAVLEAAGTSFDNVVKTTCFLANISDFTEFNEVYGKYITSAPARSCVAVKDLPKGALAEVEVIAVCEEIK